MTSRIRFASSLLFFHGKARELAKLGMTAVPEFAHNEH
jgi:hypothetical protein